MITFTSVANKLVVPAAKKLDAGIAVAVPATGMYTAKAVNYTAEKTAVVATWTSEKSKSFGERMQQHFVDAKEKHVAQAAAAAPVVVSAPVQAQPVLSEAVVAVLAASFNKMSPKDKVAFIANYPTQAQLVVDYNSSKTTAVVKK